MPLLHRQLLMPPVGVVQGCRVDMLTESDLAHPLNICCCHSGSQEDHFLPIGKRDVEHLDVFFKAKSLQDRPWEVF